MKTTFVKKSASSGLLLSPVCIAETQRTDLFVRGEWPDPTAFAHPLILAGGKNRVWITSAKFYSMTFPALEWRCYFEFVGGFIYPSLPHFHIRFQALSGSKDADPLPRKAVHQLGSAPGQSRGLQTLLLATGQQPASGLRRHGVNSSPIVW
ncbi:hypothetical protein I311_05199 [Cryptococcus gattii NT-10]|nr:hypothetical protein I311_05199 [Cryptococcus gattii NT-10]